jgi:hypothetical protein
VKIHKKAILTHSDGPQGNPTQLFFWLKSKIVAGVDDDVMVHIWPTLKKKIYFSPQVEEMKNLTLGHL